MQDYALSSSYSGVLSQKFLCIIPRNRLGREPPLGATPLSRGTAPKGRESAAADLALQSPEPALTPAAACFGVDFFLPADSLPSRTGIVRPGPQNLDTAKVTSFLESEEWIDGI